MHKGSSECHLVLLILSRNGDKCSVLEFLTTIYRIKLDEKHIFAPWSSQLSVCTLWASCHRSVCWPSSAGLSRNPAETEKSPAVSDQLTIWTTSHLAFNAFFMIWITICPQCISGAIIPVLLCDQAQLHWQSDYKKCFLLPGVKGVYVFMSVSQHLQWKWVESACKAQDVSVCFQKCVLWFGFSTWQWA